MRPLPSTNPIELLESLRWDVDSLIANHAGDRVWLGPCHDDEGRRIGITECCHADAPCDHHAALAADPHRR